MRVNLPNSCFEGSLFSLELGCGKLPHNFSAKSLVTLGLSLKDTSIYNEVRSMIFLRNCFNLID